MIMLTTVAGSPMPMPTPSEIFWSSSYPPLLLETRVVEGVELTDDVPGVESAEDIGDDVRVVKPAGDEFDGSVSVTLVVVPPPPVPTGIPASTFH